MPYAHVTSRFYGLSSSPALPSFSPTTTQSSSILATSPFGPCSLLPSPLLPFFLPTTARSLLWARPGAGTQRTCGFHLCLQVASLGQDRCVDTKSQKPERKKLGSEGGTEVWRVTVRRPKSKGLPLSASFGECSPSAYDGPRLGPGFFGSSQAPTAPTHPPP